MGLVIGRGCTYPNCVTAQSHCLEACTLKSYQDIGGMIRQRNTP
jgi:hypothetical protein